MKTPRYSSSFPLLLLLASAPLCVAQQAPLGFSLNRVVQLPTGANPNDVTVADFNHDGRPDLAIPEHGLDTLAIFAQTATGSFLTRPTVRYDIPFGPHTTVPIALDGYGPAGSPLPIADDLVVGVPAISRLYFFDNIGTVPGVTALVARPPVIWNPTGYPPQNARLLTAPLNSDPYPDLAFLLDIPTSPRHGLGGMAVYPNSTGTNRLNPTLMYQSLFDPVDFSLAAMAAPGTYDALMASPATNQVVMVEGGNSVGFSDPWWRNGYHQFFPSFGIRPMAAAGGDVDGDGWADLVAAHATNFNVVVQLRDASLPYQVEFLSNRLTYPLLGPPKQVVLQDLTGDGRPELIVLLSTALVEVFRNTGQSGQALFDAPLILGTGNGPAYLRIADINSDGLPDFAIPCATDDAVYLFYNESPLVTAQQTARLPTLQVYPNPAQSELHVTASGGIPIGEIQLLDAMGRLVRRWATAGQRLDVSALPHGIYLLRIESQNGVLTKRVVLN